METTYIWFCVTFLVGLALGVLITRYIYNHKKVDGNITFFDADGVEMPMLQMNSEDFKRKRTIILRKLSVRE